MNVHDGIDEKLKNNLGEETMTRAESDAVWDRIEQGSIAPQELFDEAKPSRPGRRRLGSAAVATVAASALIALVALSPWSDSDGGGSLGLARLDSASASEVLTATAGAAGEQKSLVPGPGQALYFHLTHTTDGDRLGDSPAMRLESVDIEEWIDAEGRGVRLDGSSGSSSSSSDGGTETSPLRTEFDAGRALERNLMASESWRALFTLDELYAMPTEPDAALGYVRGAVESSIPGGSIEEHEAGIVGVDFLVVSSISTMLMEAPLTADQRATLYELLAKTPDWYSSDGSADIEVENEGRAETVAGKEGILIEADLGLSEVEAAIVASGHREATWGVLLDPEKGTVLETQLGLVPGRPPFVWITSEALRLEPRSAMPTEG